MSSSPSVGVTPCTYYQICGLQSSNKVGGAYYCILHWPDLHKNSGVFNQALETYLNRGRSDFTYFYFPQGYEFLPPGRNFPGLANFRESVFYDDLNLKGAILPSGLILETKQIKKVVLEGATIEGDVTLKIPEKIEAVNAIGIKLSKAFGISAKNCTALNFQKAKIDGKVDIDIGEKIQGMNFYEARLRGGLTVTAGSIVEIHFTKTVTGETSIRVNDAISNLEASSGQFHSKLSIEASKIDSLNFPGIRVDGLLKLRATGTTVRLNEATIGRGLDFGQCGISVDEASFRNISFAELAEVIFDYAVLHGDLTIVGSPNPPKSVNLNGCTVMNDTTIRSALGKPLIEVLAKDSRPEFGGEVSLTNVDLKQCRLVGNSIDKMQFSNVTWKQQDGRAVLYDETILKVDGSVTKNIKEAYQVLKEKYRQLGDHVTSGDFHYGEMQMKRREYGRVRRFLGLEAWYYYLSEYGTNPKLAALALTFIILLFTKLYNGFGDIKLQQSLVEAFLVSVQAATLQPLPLEEFSLSTRILFSIERIVAPLQIALLALAIRMRLRR